MPSEIRLLCGDDIRPFIDELVHLRITLLREFPYLYDATPEYEAHYLETCTRSPWSLCALVLDESRVVGASIGVPMSVESGELQRLFLEQGWNPERVFFFGETLVLPAYRNSELLARLTAEQERIVRRLERFEWCAFCAVQRPLDHPARPTGYRQPDERWLQGGFRPEPTLRTERRWLDVGDSLESGKPMQVWLKPLV